MQLQVVAICQDEVALNLKIGTRDITLHYEFLLGAFCRGTFHIDFLVGLTGLLPSIPEDKRWEEGVSGNSKGLQAEQEKRKEGNGRDRKMGL